MHGLERRRQDRHPNPRRNQPDNGCRLARLHRHLRHKARRAAHTQNSVIDAHAGLLRIHHPRQLRQVRDLDLALARQWRIARKHQQQRIAAQRRQLKVLRQCHLRRTHETKIYFARLQGIDLVQRRHFMQGKRHVRIKLAIAADGARKQRRERRRKREPHTKFASFATLRPARPFGRTLRLRQDGPRIFEKQLAGLGQSYPALAAIKQARAHFRFQRLDLL